MSRYIIWYIDGSSEVIEIPHEQPTENELYEGLCSKCKGHWENIEDWERL